MTERDAVSYDTADDSTLALGEPETSYIAPSGRSGWRRFLRRMRSSRFAVVSFFILVLITLVAILAPWLATHDPYMADVAKRFNGPSAENWLGNDRLGRDQFSRLLYGARISMAATLQANIIAIVLGVPIGLVSGYFGGLVDTLLMRLIDALMAFPGLVLSIAIVGLLGPSLSNAMIAIGVVFSPRYARVVRGATMSVKEEVYVEAARALGARRVYIVRRHILPNILSPLIVMTTLSLGQVLLIEASLSFLGLGAQPPEASWGAMLGNAFTYIGQAPHNVIFPGLAIMIVVLAFSVLGDGLRDAFGREVRRA